MEIYLLFLIIYVILTSLSIMYSLYKTRDNTMVVLYRLINFFWVIPSKGVILSLILSYYFSIYYKLADKLFVRDFSVGPMPPIVFYILNYGLIIGLLIYALFGKYVIVGFIMSILIPFALFVVFSIHTKYSVFPYKLRIKNPLDFILIIIYFVAAFLFLPVIAYVTNFFVRFDLIDNILDTNV